MTKDTHNIKNGSYKSITAFVFLGFLIFGLFVCVSLKTAQAQEGWQNYYSVDAFYGDTLDNSAILKIHVKTSFSITYRRFSDHAFCYPYKSTNNSGALFTIIENGNEILGVIDPFSIKENGVLKYYGTSFCWDATSYSAQFIAGNTYDFKITNNRDGVYTNVLGVYSRTYYNSNAKGWFYLEDNDGVCDLFYDYPALPVLYNFGCYLFAELPTLTITYPLDNDEIAEAFYIQGSYTIPAGYNKLVAFVGRGVPYYQYSFYQDLLGDSGQVNLRIAGLPAGDNYTIRFYFYGDNVENYYVADRDIYNINLVNDIAPELPISQEVPPDIYSALSAQTIYTAYSNYPTSTALFNSIAGAIEPLITTLGNNLTFFSSQFSQTNAKDTGEQAGNSVLLVRGYVENINTFFNDLPVSQVLFLYLMALVVVVIFRLIRLLIKLIPFI